jgi:hypothetical protein
MASQIRPSFLSSGRVSLIALSGAFAMLLGVFAGCRGAKGPITVPLQFRPTHAEPLSGTISATDVKVHLEPVNDKRDNQEQIGRNVEGETPIPVYAGADPPPAEFVHNVIEEELKNFGVELTDTPEAADRVIAVDLTKFWVEEGNNYKAEVKGTARVRDKGGHELWKGTVAGNGTGFGRSLKAVNYNEVLSDGTRRLVGSLLANPKFQEALAR